MGEKQRRTSGVNRRRFVKLAGAGATVGLAGYTDRQDGQDTVKVGAIYPLSGSVGETGTRIRQVVNSAAEDVINSEQPDLEPLALASEAGLPGLDGAEVEVVWADHRGDPGQGRAEAERMVQEENVDLLYGAYHSSVSKTISQVAEREQVPHVTGESSSPDLTERGLEWFWRVGPHDQIFTENMFAFFDGLNENRDAGLETVAIIHEDTEFGAVSANVQEELCNEYGYEVVAGPISYTAESITSFSSEIGRIREADPDVLLPTSYVRDAVMMAEEMRQQDFMPDVVMGQNAGHNDPGFVGETDVSNYFCSRSTFADDMTEAVPEIGRYDDFVTERTDVSFNGVFIRSWGGFITAMKGVDNAGSTEPDAIREGLNSLTMDRLETGLPFGVQFQDDGQNGEASGVLVQFHDGASRLVWPFDLASDDAFTFPAPTWSER